MNEALRDNTPTQLAADEGGHSPSLQELDQLLGVETKWYRLGLQLGVRADDLEIIEKNYPRDADTCKIKMFAEWRRSDTNPTYEKLVRALTAVGKRKLAESVCSRKGIPLSVLDDTDAINAHQSHDPTVKAATAKEAVILSPDEESDAVTAAKKKIEYLQDEYKQLVMMTQEAVKAKSPTLTEFRTSITLQLPESIRSEVEPSLKKDFQYICDAKSIDAIFFIFNLGIWSYLNFGLLQYLVKIYGDEKLQKRIENYSTSVESFRKQTTLKIFWKADPNKKKCPEIPPEFRESLKRITFKHGNLDPATTTLNDIEQHRKDLAQQYSLPEFTIILEDIDEGCIATTWLVPPSLAAKLADEIKRGNVSFLEQHNLKMQESTVRHPEAVHTTDGAISGHLQTEGSVLEISFSDLEFGDELGEGAFGVVYRGHWKSRDMDVAIKRVPGKINKTEIEILNKLRHPSIIQFHGVVVDRPGPSEHYIITELAEGGSLYDLLYRKRYQPNQEESLRWVKQIAQGMKYLHQGKMMHRDLKSSNVLLTGEGNIKICDFGGAKYFDYTTKQTQTGTYRWMAPEVMKGEQVSLSSDVFSYGMLLYEILTGELPFADAKTDVIVGSKIMSGELPLISDSMESYLAEMLKQCWNTNPKARPSFHDILETLITRGHYTATCSHEGADDPYSVWTCSLTRQERNLGLGIIVQLVTDSEDEQLQSLLPCLGKKLLQQKVDLQPEYALLTCHSNLDVLEDDDKPKYFNLKGLQACVGPAQVTVSHKIALEDCVSCAVSCCGPTSMLMLSPHAPDLYTLLPHTSSQCPIGYDFVILFLNNRFEPDEATPPPEINVSQCLDLANLRTRLAWQSGAQTCSSVAAGEFCLYSCEKSGLKMVPVTVQYSKEQREGKRFCDEIDWYEKHQRLNYNCDLNSQSFNGAPVIFWHEGKGSLVGISSNGNQVVTLYGMCQLLAGGPVPLFAAMKFPSPRTLLPFRWSPHILLHLAKDIVTNKGHLLEMFHLLVEREEGSRAALLNLVIADTMNVSVTAMEILSEILKKFSGPEELKAVIKEGHIFEPPNMSEDDFKGCILRVCKRLKGFMHHFSYVQRGINHETILESVFHCTETMLYWSLQYPDVAELLLSIENIESASKAADSYCDSRSINNSFKRIRQRRDRMVEQDLVMMRWQKAALQKELKEKEQELKNKHRSEDHVESRNEEDKGRVKRGSDRSAIPASKRAKLDEEQQKAAARDRVLSASPTIRMLMVLKGPGDQKVEIVATVARKWKEIGLLLDFDATGQHLDMIETGYEKDPYSCCQAMFQHWLKGNGVEQTWGILVDILKDCKLGMLAESVEKVLMAIDQPT